MFLKPIVYCCVLRCILLIGTGEDKYCFWSDTSDPPIFSKYQLRRKETSIMNSEGRNQEDCRSTCSNTELTGPKKKT